MLEWLLLIASTYAIAAKTSTWRSRVPLAALAGLLSAIASAIPKSDPLAQVDRAIIGTIINFVLGLFMIAFFAWLRRSSQVRRLGSGASPPNLSQAHRVPHHPQRLSWGMRRMRRPKR